MGQSQEEGMSSKSTHYVWHKGHVWFININPQSFKHFIISIAGAHSQIKAQSANSNTHIINSKVKHIIKSTSSLTSKQQRTIK